MGSLKKFSLLLLKLLVPTQLSNFNSFPCLFEGLHQYGYWINYIYSFDQVYAQMETCSEELYVERMVSKGLKTVVLSPTSEKSAKPSSARSPTLQLVWGTTMYHIDDLPFDTNSLPDVYTQFRKVTYILFMVSGSLSSLALLNVFLTRCFFF